MSAPKWAVGMRKIGPGMYVKDGELHFQAVELCEHLGCPPTRENLKMAEEVAAEVFRKECGATVSVEHVWDED